MQRTDLRSAVLAKAISPEAASARSKKGWETRRRGKVPDHMAQLQRMADEMQAAQTSDPHNDDHPAEFDHMLLVPLPKDYSKRLGDCYLLSGRYAMDHPGSTLVHGHISQGNNGVMHGYVITKNGNYYEPITDRIYTPENGKRLFGFRDIAKYDWDEMRTQMLRHSHWGPWDAESEAWYAERGGQPMRPDDHDDD